MDPKRRRIVVYCLVGAVVLSVVVTALYPGSRVARRGLYGVAGVSLGDAIGVIYIEGEITGGHSTSGILGGTLGGDTVLSYIRQAQNDPSIKALVLRINSPGGSAAASDEISEEIKKFRRSGRKVVASMADVAASGAYWVACSADKIWASQGTMTGSIGVIFEITRLEELYKKIGVDIDVIKSGAYKDIGSTARPLTDEERKILQSMVDDVFDQFVTTVAEGRKMSRENVVKIADGRVFTGRQAKDLGLVDELGNMYDAVNDAARLAGLKSWTLREYGRLSPLERLLQNFPSDMGSHAVGLTGDRFHDALWILRQIVKMPGY